MCNREMIINWDNFKLFITVPVTLQICNKYSLFISTLSIRLIKLFILANLTEITYLDMI